MFQWIAFDADDTLWHNEKIYRMGRERFRGILAKYDLQGDVEGHFNEVEIRNLRYYGYGVMSFVLSMIEAALQLTDGKIRAEDIQTLLDLSKEMLTAEVTLFDGARELISDLSVEYPLMLITKGDLSHQKRKVEESGLLPHFQAVEVVSEKTVGVYEEILGRHQVDVSHFLMVGNSIRSDIQPILELGGWAVHVVPHLTWDYEGGDIEGDLKERFWEAEDLGNVRQAIFSLQERKANLLGEV
ncbi:MAG: HAD family hydrolase [Anaerolineales bacterium]